MDACSVIAELSVRAAVMTSLGFEKGNSVGGVPVDKLNEREVCTRQRYFVFMVTVLIKFVYMGL
jgi:hypothetical protein